jgi:hypothetical protein
MTLTALPSHSVSAYLHLVHCAVAMRLSPCREVEDDLAPLPAGGPQWYIQHVAQARASRQTLHPHGAGGHHVSH